MSDIYRHRPGARAGNVSAAPFEPLTEKLFRGEVDQLREGLRSFIGRVLSAQEEADVERSRLEGVRMYFEGRSFEEIDGMHRDIAQRQKGAREFVAALLAATDTIQGGIAPMLEALPVQTEPDSTHVA